VVEKLPSADTAAIPASPDSKHDIPDELKTDFAVRNNENAGKHPLFHAGRVFAT
jgi:hypothetical protein